MYKETWSSAHHVASPLGHPWYLTICVSLDEFLTASFRISWGGKWYTTHCKPTCLFSLTSQSILILRWDPCSTNAVEIIKFDIWGYVSKFMPTCYRCLPPITLDSFYKARNYGGVEGPPHIFFRHHAISYGWHNNSSVGDSNYCYVIRRTY